MIRLIGIVSILLTSTCTIHAQEKEPPKTFTNSIGMKFVWIPAGHFLMGSPNKEKGRGDDEIVHKVTFSKAFYMGTFLVTQEQWQAVMGNNPSEFKGAKNLPVDSVSWDDCQAFCKKLSEKEQKTYRLPTESEWEYCCRAGTTTPFHNGETLAPELANYNGNYTYGDGKKGVYLQKTVPVGSYAANPWGLYDMHGNLWQWCQDWHGGYPRTDAVDPQGARTGKYRSLRGGSWGSHPVFCRAANRNYIDPEKSTEYYGFRVCLVP
ncbi:MAG: formylglycine-generating enzyme family protein [Planctomycetes bacterium]|nr:formylglycine-generating enzyme family protein [Planctomycetota bacterium]